MGTSINLLLTLLSVPHGIEPGTIQIGTTNGDKVYFTSVSPERLKRTPEWKDTSKEPPLSALKALNLAEAKQKELSKKRGHPTFCCVKK
jgi:hypothetical protein